MPRAHDLDREPSTLTPADDTWPAALDALPDAPARVRIAGAIPPLEGAVAVVGTRYADEEALAFTVDLAASLAAAGRTVVSGGAWGVDAAAHRGALEAGGQTIAVLPTGFDRVYPARHRGLFARIARGGGALLTEIEDGQHPVPWTFLARNRLIAALGTCCVVVQAPHRSGAMSTAAAARRLKKEVFSVPYAPWDVRGAGCLELLSRGARVCTSARDILSLRPPGAPQVSEINPPDNEKRNVLEGLDDDSRLVLGILSRTARHPDELALSADLPISRVLRGLLQLQLRGLAKRRADGTYATKASTGQR